MDSKAATVRSRMWRERERKKYGGDLYKRHNAVKMKIYRKKKIVQTVEKKVLKARAKKTSTQPFVKISSRKRKSKGSLNGVEGSNTRSSPSVVTLQDDIYASKDGPPFKEGDISQRHLVFKHPFTCLIAGPTSSGKTVFTTRVIDSRLEMIEPNVDEIIWCYGIESPQLAKLKERFPGVIKLHKGLPDLDKLGAMDSKVNRLLVLDDLMNETRGNTVANLFSKGAHHMNISVVYIVQNVFNQNKEMRNVFLNAQYKVLFNNPSDLTQLTVLNSRMFPGHPNFLKSVMADASVEKSHAYIALDVHPRTPSDLRVRTEIFPGEDNNVFLPNA